MLLPRLGTPEADRHALYRRGEAAAKSAAAGYEVQGDLVIGCMCIGQPRDEGAREPSLEECKWDPNLWTLPQRPDRIRLGFLWFIAKRGWEELAHFHACSARAHHLRQLAASDPIFGRIHVVSCFPLRGVLQPVARP